MVVLQACETAGLLTEWLGFLKFPQASEHPPVVRASSPTLSMKSGQGPLNMDEQEIHAVPTAAWTRDVPDHIAYIDWAVLDQMGLVVFSARPSEQDCIAL